MAAFLAASVAYGVPLRHDFQGVKESIQALVEPDGRVSRRVLDGAGAQHAPLEARRREPRGRRRARSARVLQPHSPPAVGAARINVQCRRSVEGELRIHEFSGRFTGATVDRWLLGHDEVGAAIEAFTGRRLALDREPPAAADEAFEASGYRSVPAALAASLARDGAWRRTA